MYGGNNLTLTVLIIVVALGLSVWEERVLEPYREVGYGQEDGPLPESACLPAAWRLFDANSCLETGDRLDLRVLASRLSPSIASV